MRVPLQELPKGWRKANLPTKRAAALTSGDGVPALWRSIAGAFGMTLTANDAMGITTVFACVKCLADTMAMLPLKIYRSKNKDSEELDGHPLSKVLRFPNDLMTSFDLRHALTANIALNGSGYAVINRDRLGRAAELVPVPTAQVSAFADGNDIKYRIFNAFTGRNETLPFDRVLHLRGGVSFDGMTSIGAVTGLARVLKLAQCIDTFTSSFFANGASPGIMVESEHDLSPEQVASLRMQISTRLGDGTNDPFILGKGQKVISLPNSNSSNQTGELRHEQDLAICRVFRVPPQLIGIKTETSFSNMEQQGMNFVTNTLAPLCVMWEQAFDSLIDSNEQHNTYFMHNMKGLLRGDTAARYNSYAIGRQQGFLSANDIRRLEDMPPIEGGDEYLTPMNMSASGSGSTSNPGSPTTKMNQSRLDLAFMNGWQGGPIPEYALTRLQERNVTKRNLEKLGEVWGNAEKLKYKAEAPSNELRIFGSIGESFWSDESITLTSVQNWLDTQSGDIVVRINSPGGDVFQGNGIQNALSDYAKKGHKVAVKIDALAASIATGIMMGGTSIEMASNALIMIHNAWVYTAGNAKDLMKEVVVLQKIDETIVDTYHKKTGIPKEEIATMLENDTWMTAQEAKDKGFVDSITGAVEVEDTPAPEPQQQQLQSVTISAAQKALLERLNNKSAAWKKAA